MNLLGYDMRGFRERRVGRSDIAEMRIDEEIAGRRAIKLRRAGRERGLDIDGERQRFIIDEHRFGGVPGLGLCFGDDHRHRFADMARALDRQQLMRTDEDGACRAAIRRGELHIEFRRRHRIMRNGFQPVGAAICAGKNAEHAGHGARFIGIDAIDSRMRMRRTHESRDDLAGDAEIIGVAAMTSQQPEILFPRQPLAAVPEREARERIHQPSFTCFSRPGSHSPAARRE